MMTLVVLPHPHAERNVVNYILRDCHILLLRDVIHTFSSENNVEFMKFAKVKERERMQQNGNPKFSAVALSALICRKIYKDGRREVPQKKAIFTLSLTILNVLNF